MRNFYIIFFLILIITFPIGAQNLIPNPGFEEGIYIDHDLMAFNGSEVVFSGSDTEVFQGDSALMLDISVVGTGGPQVIGVRHTITGLEASKKYSFRAAVKGPVGQQFRFRVAGDGKQTKNITISNSEYQVYEYVIDALLPSADGEYTVAVEFAFTDNVAGTWYVDSLVLEFVEDGGSGGDPGTLSVVYVSPEGLDTNDGSINMPVKTLSMASELLAGDTIFLMEGSYHEEFVFTNFTGQTGVPKVITAVHGHEVIFDGTIPVESLWELYEGQIYKTTLSEDIWQLFVNGEMLNLCRWPNVDGFIEDEQPEAMDPLPLSLWDQSGTWGHSASNSTNGLMIDDGAKGLGASGLDMTGAIAVLNVGSFKTSAAPVASHIPGQDQFTYDSSYTDPNLSWQKPDHAYYYLEGKLNLLDKPGEWFYDKETKELFVYTKDGSNPALAEVRGKNQTYAMQFDNCAYVELRNIKFFGTTITGWSSPYLQVENCEFTYPSYSGRLLGDYSQLDVTLFSDGCDNMVFRNNIIQYTEGEALHHEGKESLIENNLMRHIDFTCANIRMLGGTVNFKSDNTIFRNNTIYIAGASETLAPGSHNTVEGNDIWGIGHLQNDGSMVQYMVGPAVGSVTRFNWFHDCKKSGMRYDGSLTVGNTDISGYWEPWGTQTKGQVYKNVIWNVPTGLMIKGDYHVVVNNTVFDNSKVGIIMMNPPPDGANHFSICKNNVSEMLSGYRGGRTPDEYPLTGDHSNNWNGFFEDDTIIDILSDIENRDFRPVSQELLIEKGTLDVDSDDLFPEHTYIDSTYDIGAYEYGDTLYNIPGRREVQTTHPIPANGSVSKAPEIMIAWRPAYKASAYRLYVGNNLESVDEATPESQEYKGVQDYNIYVPDTTSPGELIFWRVDALVGGEVITGNVWSFYAGEDTTTVVIDTLSNIKFQISIEGTALENAEVILDGEKALTDHLGEVVFNEFENGKSYNYSVQLNGYEDVEGVILLEKDTLINVNMVLETGLEAEEIFKVNVYPNPANGFLQIDASQERYSVEIVNIFGQVVLRDEQYNANGKIDISSIEQGVYVVIIADKRLNRIWESIIIAR